ncbi:MAG: hypothetical protein CM15mP49_06100 [Actinomycetota bacterium]|nr:MAG: hypothetical protein CM15mP49_06100 [Actinomycetota bacterium]
MAKALEALKKKPFPPRWKRTHCLGGNAAGQLAISRGFEMQQKKGLDDNAKFFLKTFNEIKRQEETYGLI